MYGYSKQMFDLWAKRRGLLDVIAGCKFSNIYGPNERHKANMRSVVLRSWEQITESGKMQLFRSYKKEYADGEQLRQIGREFGATTGRPRRCGWFDAVAARYSCMVDGIDLLAITKLDCLDGFDKIAICTGYEINGKVTDRFPASLDDLEAVKPVYEWHDGWKQDISEARSWDDLPENAKKYLERVAELVRSKIAIISVGPRRDQTFSVEK
jgi:adenylosuccinate synthase